MTPVLQIIARRCSPARHVGRLVDLASKDGWQPYVTLTPSATKWAEVDDLERSTGLPVRWEYRAASEQKAVPECDALVLCPATINTVNKWAAGICDTLALGALVESIGRGIPIVAVPYGNEYLTAHPRYVQNIVDLRKWGVVVLDLPATSMRSDAWRPDAAVDLWGHVLAEVPAL